MKQTHTQKTHNTHIKLLVKASQKEVDRTGGQTRGSERTWVEIDRDEETDGGAEVGGKVN